MSLQRGKLGDIAYIASTAGSVLTNASGTKTYVRSVMLHNTNSSAETVELYNVPDSTGSLGTAGAANRFFKKDVAADETLFIDLEYPIVLTDENDSIQAVTTTASKVTIQLMGDKDA